MLNVRALRAGIVGTNVYIVYKGNTAVIIDPAADCKRIEGLLESLKITKLEAILLTHGHFDHIMALPDLKGKWNPKIYAFIKEKDVFSDPEKNLSEAFVGESFVLDTDGIIFLKDNETISLLEEDWKVLWTPGHTEGSACFLTGNLLFSGDTLFHESFGRTDFPTGNEKTLIESIMDRLFCLPDTVRVLPGHENETTIGHEKKFNPALMIGRMIYKKEL